MGCYKVSGFQTKIQTYIFTNSPLENLWYLYPIQWQQRQSQTPSHISETSILARQVNVSNDSQKAASYTKMSGFSMSFSVSLATTSEHC